MTKRHRTPEHVKLHTRISEVLHYLWDPIGMSHEPQARNEYAPYALKVLRMVSERKSATEIAAYLMSVESESMGLEPPNSASAEKAAEVALAWGKMFFPD